ncbi:TIGR04283 family arsenosugar biosynthesis glycosyltransferase [uncultured Limnobacter sp.]|uniref:TIGR04283 family arsenosugar biosynthesis glycosyltransferase n=1 Tax=uncultured Limnobacter sp. TaxID=199681 RepID=UPI0030F6F3CC
MPFVSIVMPVYNEVPGPGDDSLSVRIHALIELLRQGDELLLVDGGSTDHSWATLQLLAVHPQVTLIQSGKGRAQQMNSGAAQARGEVLLFLHADTVLNSEAWSALLTKLNECLWGRFDVRIEGKSAWLPVVAWFMNRRSRLSKIGTGDQALFVSRALFNRVGGFPDQSLMEDIELCKRLKRVAPRQFLAISSPVFTSGRRWDLNGAWATILLMWRFRFLYWRGVSAETLAKLYADTRQKSPLTVAVFAKYPYPGRVKTRLAPLLGAEQCAAFARYLLLSTLDKLQGMNVVLWTDGGSDQQWAELLRGRAVQRCVQPEGHLGKRMQTAVETHLKRSELVVLLGPDAIEFTQADLHELQRAARQCGLAFVPAHDGGYVALACNRNVPEIFSASIAWGTASVAEQTRAALQQHHLSAVWLPSQLDIDEPADLDRAIELGCLPVDWPVRYQATE